MNASTKAAIAAAHKAIDLLEVAVADTEPAPVSIVLTRDRSSGRIHRRFRVEGIEGYASYELDNLDQAGAYDVIPDLSTVGDEGELCKRCFGELDTDEVPE